MNKFLKFNELFDKAEEYFEKEAFTIALDFIDTAFEEEARICHLCHECAHKFLLWIGRRSPAWINSIGTTSHPRNTCKRNCEIDHNCFTKGYTNYKFFIF